MGAFIDEAGNKYGSLTVIERAPNHREHVHWLCSCDCGNEATVDAANLRSGMTRSCGCYKLNNHVKDEVGKKYGRLTVIARAASLNGRERAHWLCKCECGNEKVIGGHDLRRGRVKSCGCLLKEQPSSTLPNGEAAFRRMYYQYKKSAERRELDFPLSKHEFRRFTKQPCHYCGQKPQGIWKSVHNTGDYICNGIDRKNNDIGYVIDNCVPCCTQCNYFKTDMEYDKFVEYLDRVAVFRGLA